MKKIKQAWKSTWGSKNFSVRFPDEQMSKLVQLSKKLKEPRGAVIKLAIDFFWQSLFQKGDALGRKNRSVRGETKKGKQGDE